MTINTQTNKAIVLGDGSTTQFAFGFIGVAAAYITVIYTDASGNETVLMQGSGGTQYQIALNAPVEGAIWGAGGTVTYDPSGTPIASGTTLTIFRTLPLTQAISLQNQISLAALGNGAETGLDTGTMQLQQVFEQIGRAIVAPIVDATPPAPLPPIAQRANQGAAFDAFGNLVAGSTPASGVISTAMQPVVSAASLALGRAAFGLGTMAVESIGAGLEDDGSGNARVNFGVTAVASNQTIDKTFHLQQLELSGPLTLSLDRADTLWDGFGFFGSVLQGTVIITPDSHDQIEGGVSGASIVIPAGASFYLSTNALSSGTWYIALAQAGVARPGGYLTPQSMTPSILGDVTSGTLYYTADASGFVPVFNGVFPVVVPFAELSASLAAGYAANTAYDWFVALIAGVATLVSGPAWRNAGQPITGATNAAPIVITANGHNLVSGDDDTISGVQGNTAANGRWTVTVIDANTYSLNGSVGNGAYTANTGQHAARGAGAGTTQIARPSPGGFYTNAVAITARNGTFTSTIPANQATYVGSTLIDASGNTVTCHRTAGQSRLWGIFNAYNRKPVRLQVTDPTSSWTYNSSPVRASNGNTNNSLRVFLGLTQEDVDVSFAQGVSNSDLSSSSTLKISRVGIGLNNATVYSGLAAPVGIGAAGNAANASTPTARLVMTPSLGTSLVYSLEGGNATSGLTTTFSGTIMNMLLTAAWNG